MVTLEHTTLREELSAYTTLLSETDLFGTIVFVNDAFCRVSRYSRSELIGKPHNIIRHPDMPKEIFALMWDTIKRGDVFRGVLKNKSKTGTHYWVNVTIMPILGSDGKITKYVGARYHLRDEERAQSLYNEQCSALGLRIASATNTNYH